MHRIEVREAGITFATRSHAGRVVKDLRASSSAGDLIVDFGGVLSVSGSFADEFVAMLEARTGTARVRVEHAGPEVHTVIRRVLDRRESAIELAPPAALAAR